MKNKYLLSILIALPSSAFAQLQLTESLYLDGFGTFAAAKSDNNTPVLFNRDITDEWCFDCDTTMGLQLNWAITPKLRSAIQVVKRPQDTFSEPEIERAFVEYSLNETKIKAGRLRVPIFIMSEYYFVSSAYPWLRLPSEVYNNTLGITHYEGIAVDWSHTFEDDFQLNLTPFYSRKSNDRRSLYGEWFNLEIKQSYGFSADLFFGDNTIHASVINASVVQEYLNQLPIEFDLQLYSAGFSYYIDKLHLQSELLVSREFHVNWYASVDYNIKNWTPYFQYGQARRAFHSNTYLTGVRYDITPSINLKMEWQRIYGQKAIISGQFTMPQNPLEPLADKVDIFSAGISFTF
ncbi:sulfate ABC transporter permease [Vibrio sp. NTOU-M3]|uniref:sulfate ABC transporter permease n=1 Tax=Vibrio sp. NTOU-M3 TaxID=3234954 RepID=UPI00349F6121